jgi:hypothetical protein
MEVWGINDAYQHCPEVKRFYKIYNIHKAFPECADNMPGRYKDWRRCYDNSKALIITAKDLGLRKQRVLDITKLRKENPDYVFCSSVSYAIFEAVNAGYKEIRLYRLSLNAGEYATQGRGIIDNIKWAQARGVIVYWPWYKEVSERFKRGEDQTNIFYGEADINYTYGETFEASAATVKDTAKAIKQDDVKASPELMTVAELKAGIKAKGGSLPKGRANKPRLIQIYKELSE